MNNVDATPHTNFIYNFLKNPSPNSSNHKKSKGSVKFKKQISFSNVSFSYNEDRQNEILKDINLNIKHGSRIGIIGKSGSGKSTLADLILGLLNPSKGKILVDGTTILGKQNNWYKNVAGVPQNIFITQQSIAENIAFGENIKKINFQNLKNSAKKAQISQFIEERKDKYFSLIGEKGLKISAGQRQRLAIARALYKKSKLIVFDEATSALDVKSENNILNTIFKLSRQKYTLILISHKISNLKKCDHIYKIHNSKLYKIK
jgi:ATP-binding cassette subfamily B protein